MDRRIAANGTYDDAGAVTGMTYPSGRIVTYGRDSLGRILGVTTQQNAGAAGVTLASNIVYEPYGVLQWLTYGNGLSLWKTFTGDDELNQLLVNNPVTNVSLIQRFHTRTDNLNLTDRPVQMVGMHVIENRHARVDARLHRQRQIVHPHVFPLANPEIHRAIGTIQIQARASTQI